MSTRVSSESQLDTNPDVVGGQAVADRTNNGRATADDRFAPDHRNGHHPEAVTPASKFWFRSGLIAMAGLTVIAVVYVVLMAIGTS